MNSLLKTAFIVSMAFSLLPILGGLPMTSAHQVSPPPPSCSVPKTASQTSSDGSMFAESDATQNTCSGANSGKSYYEVYNTPKYSASVTLTACGTQLFSGTTNKYVVGDDIWTPSNTCQAFQSHGFATNTRFSFTYQSGGTGASSDIEVETQGWSGYCNSAPTGACDVDIAVSSPFG